MRKTGLDSNDRKYRGGRQVEYFVNKYSVAAGFRKHVNSSRKCT